MALADYDTAVEKIAALKCAQLDPSISIVELNEFTTTDIIYIIGGRSLSIDSKFIGFIESESWNLNNFRVPNNVVVSPGYSIIYIKDSDITYTDPITTYQNRLAAIISTELSVVTNAIAGVNGSILVNGQHTDLNGAGTDHGSWFYSFAVPAGTSMQTSWAGYYFSYFDVPADW